MEQIRNSILAGITFGILMGLCFCLLYDSNLGLKFGVLSGLFFGLAIYFFVNSNIVKKQTEIENLNGETEIHSGSANHFKNNEAAGGKLYLLKKKLIFKSHNFNIQNHEEVIDIQNIKSVQFYNTLGLIPNGLKIILENGNIEKFVVNGRKLWKEKIEIIKEK